MIGLYIVCVVCVLVVIPWIVKCIRSACRRRTNHINQLVNSSAGTFDCAAKSAFETLSALPDKTPHERMQYANLLRFNIAENNITRHAPRIAAEYDLVVRSVVDNATNNALTTISRDTTLHQIEDFNNLLIEHNIVTALNETLVNNAPRIRKDDARERRATLSTRAPNRLEAAKAILSDAATMTNDPQNVHDSKVGSDLRSTVAKIKCNVTPELVYSTIANAKSARQATPEAIITLNEIAKGGHISTFNDTEDKLFTYVWQRSLHPDNAPQRENIQDAIFTALSDSVEKGTLVCMNGRCGRVLGSLATLDFDPTVGSAMSYEAYKNQIYHEVKEIVDTWTESSKADPAMAEDAAAYESGENFNPAGEFIKGLKVEIDTQLDTYKDVLDINELKNLKDSSYIYAFIE